MVQVTQRPRQWQGRVAPDFEVKTLEGETFRLSDRVGKEVVILNFFATWCGPCRAEMPELIRFHAENAGRPVTVLGIDAYEKMEVVEPFLRTHKVSFAVAIDEGEVQKAFGVSSFPTTVLVGADGRIHLYETRAIANADVTLKPPTESHLARLARGEGIATEAYREAAKREVYPGPAPSPGDGVALHGRAASIAEKMDCPCGCDDKVAKCGCKTSKNIKGRLAQGGLEGRTDEDVVRELNREFCMAGM